MCICPVAWAFFEIYKITLVLEWAWCMAKDNRRRAVRLMTLYKHRDQYTFYPGPLYKFLDFVFPCPERAFAILGIEQETVEVAKAVVDQSGHFASEGHEFLTLVVRRLWLVPFT